MHPARALWRLIEPYHAQVYFAAEGREEYAAAGLKGNWMAYFASRSAPMGAVGPGVVTATFHNFAPRMVERSLPDAWRLSSPARVLEARWTVVDRSLRRLLGDDVVTSEPVREAAELVRRAATGCDPAARPIYAAHATLDWPEPPHLDLWHGIALLREHRFDGHVAALLCEGLDGVECHVTASRVGGLMDAATLKLLRGWSDEEWLAAEDRLRTRGLLGADGDLTIAGRALRDAVEHRTDDLAAVPVEHLGTEGWTQLEGTLRPVITRLLDNGALPFPNPVGATRPT